ncbi:Hermansky-Pudlak syndrome 3 protein homolog [Lytechinus variegatus]|uniref:Hermansky-Pudlak syndrome 3 protein homolog n=1 Tax=Lytechinus variegatus TaxID=7654 RepID=UPI001BB22624|nr:Hermansky-Pudlak syndrome 3 protein homolog [Lytechinus variegatus]XP_041479924.1 Hermansky-Pudlak syndrome 3 protein homolog [Lytechinus variegatus]
MVQVLSCHHFKSQTVVSPSHEPHIIFASGKHLFVATSHQTVEVYLLDGSDCTLVHTVKTIGLAWKGAFCLPGNYILLLEDEDGKFNNVRAYFNWDQWDKSTKTKSGSPTKVVPTESQGLEVVEVRPKRHVQCFSCCSENGNLVLGMRDIISIYRLVVHSGQHDFQLFIDIVIDGFKTANVDICGAHLAFTSFHEAHVLRINSQKFHISCASDGAADSISVRATGSSKPSEGKSHMCKSTLDSFTDRKPSDTEQDNYFVNDSHFIECTFDARSLSVRPSEPSATHNRIVLQSILDEEYLKQKDGPAETLGPVSSIPGIAPFKVRHAEKAKSEKRSSSEKVPSYVHLLYCRFSSTEASLMLAQLLPTYTKAPFTLEKAASAQAQTSESFHSRKLLGMCCLLSTPKQGLVYDVTGQVIPLSCYLYTGEAISLQAGEDFLYAASSSGLETYSHRVSAAAIYNKETFDGKSNACPDPTTDICLVGLRPFLSVQKVVSCDSHVILLCKAPNDQGEESGSDWSVYVLQKAPASDLLDDMIELATGFRQASVSAYQHLIMEAHLMMRSKMLQCCHGDEEDETEEYRTIEHRYRETSALLGQIYAQSTNATDWSLAVPYLTMSEHSLSEVLEAVTGSFTEPFIPEDHHLGLGLTDFLDVKLFQEDSSNEPMNEEIAERVVDVYHHVVPSRCSQLFLSSEVKGHLSPQKKLEVLHSLKKLQSENSYQWSARDNIAMILINLELGEMEQAKFATSCLTPDEVTHLIPDNSSLILDANRQFTDFAKLMCKEATECMVEVLLCLLDHDQLTLKETLCILKEYSPGSLGSCPLLTRLLELVMCSGKWQNLYSEAMPEIVSIYLSQLLHADQPSMMNTSRACRRTHAHVPQGDGCFAARFNWLNKLPPFQGSLRQTCTGLEQKARNWRLQRGRSGSVTQPQTPTKSGAPCPCCCCNEVLMRLQSLLCSEHLTDEVSLYVINGIEDMKECRGKGSLQLLCQTKLDTKTALSVVIQEYPSIAVEFSSQHCGHREDLWSHVLSDLVKGLEEKTTDGMETRKAISLQMLSGVLGYLVQELEASALISLLPSDLPLTLTMPYMERSLLRDRASRLREEIVATGMESIKGC